MSSFAQVEDIPGLPASLEAEIAILGAMMLDPLAIMDALERLYSYDFSLDSHQRIYQIIIDMVADGVAVDMITVGRRLADQGKLSSIGGPAYLHYLSEGIPRNLNIEAYVRIVKDKSHLREIIQVAQRMINEAVDGGSEAMEIVSRAGLELMEITAEAQHRGAEEVATIIPRVVERVRALREAPTTDDALGYATGIGALDRKTKGLYPNEYTIILGETGGAKTALATQIVVVNAMREVRSHVFSMEMTKEQLTQRAMVWASGSATAKDVRDPRFLNITDWTDFQRTGDRMMELPIAVDDARQLPLDKLLAKAKVAIHRDGAKLIVVDYLQLIGCATGKRQTDAERIDATTLALRDLAAESKQLGVHVVALSQYSRPQDGRGGAKNSRAKGSSSLEQSAHNMWHIVREQTETGEYADEGEIVIGKSREGTLGKIPFRFDGEHLRFLDIER